MPPKSDNNKKPTQLPLFKFAGGTYTSLALESDKRWYYLASPRSTRMIAVDGDGFAIVPYDLQHGQPWLTNNRKNAVRVAVKVPGIWKLKIYPYNPR